MRPAETAHWPYKLRHPGWLQKELLNARVREGIEVQKTLNGLVLGIRNS